MVLRRSVLRPRKAGARFPGAYSFAAMRDRRLIAVGGLVALGALVRFSTLDLQSFWYDEAVTVDLVRRSFTGTAYGAPNRSASGACPCVIRSPACSTV